MTTVERMQIPGLLSGFDTPKARASDPLTAHEAASTVRPGQREMEELIFRALLPGPLTAFQIAEYVCGQRPGRWDEGSVRTTVSRLGKRGRIAKADSAGKSPRGQRCDRWFLPSRLIGVENVSTGGRL